MIKIDVLDRLRESLLELEKAVQSAKSVILKKKSAGNYAQRIENYEQMLIRQKELLLELEMHMTTPPLQPNEIQRRVSLINGLSEMIRDDARMLLHEIGRGGGLSKKELELFKN